MLSLPMMTRSIDTAVIILAIYMDKVSSRGEAKKNYLNN